MAIRDVDAGTACTLEGWDKHRAMSASESSSYESTSDASITDTEAESDISLDASMPGPYSFEPSASDTSSCDTTAESASSSDGDEDTSRITDMSW